MALLVEITRYTRANGTGVNTGAIRPDVCGRLDMAVTCWHFNVKVEVEEHEWPSQSPDLSPTDLWDELGLLIYITSYLTSVSDLTATLSFHGAMLQNLVEVCHFTVLNFLLHQGCPVISAKGCRLSFP